MKTIEEHLAEIIPFGEKCYGCPKGDPYSEDIYCHLMEENMPDGNKECMINDSRVVLEINLL